MGRGDAPGGFFPFVTINPVFNQVEVNGDVFTEDWVNYNLTEAGVYGGWQNFTAESYIRYRTVGKLVFCQFTISGIGQVANTEGDDSYSAKFILPFLTREELAVGTPIGWAYTYTENLSGVGYHNIGSIALSYRYNNNTNRTVWKVSGTADPEHYVTWNPATPKKISGSFWFISE